MAKKGNVDQSDFSSLDDRTDFALNLKEGLTPGGVVEDWGDYEEDYPTQTDVKGSTFDEVVSFYNETQPIERLTIKPKEDS